jgi:hypothetical protein
MDYKKILKELEKFAEKEYVKLAEEYPINTASVDLHGKELPMFKDTVLGQNLKRVECKITFNYSKVHIFMSHGDGGGIYCLMFDCERLGGIDKRENYIEKMMFTKTTPFKVKAKTVKFSY